MLKGSFPKRRTGPRSYVPLYIYYIMDVDNNDPRAYPLIVIGNIFSGSMRLTENAYDMIQPS